MCKLGVISQERLKIDVKLLLSANRKSYRLAQQRMTFSHLEWLKSTSSASRAISAVAELLDMIWRLQGFGDAHTYALTDVQTRSQNASGTVFQR